MNKYIVLFSLFICNLMSSQNQIIVGPQNDCALKKISKNVHTSSEWFDVTGVTKLKITTFQHRTYDKSKIYNETGELIWQWSGESYSDTWYKKEHFLDINTNKIKVEFTQGYSDPFCDGYVKVEKFSFNSQKSSNQDVNIASVSNVNIKIQTKGTLSDESLDCKECKEIVDLFYESYSKGIPINSIDFFPMKALVAKCYKQNYKDCGGKIEKQLETLAGGVGGPLSYGENSVWKIPGREDFSRFNFDKIETINNFKNSILENSIKDCSECKDAVSEYFNSFLNKKIINEEDFKKLKSKVEVCSNQKYAECGSAMEKQLETLAGGSGGPMRYGEDSKWRIEGKFQKIKNINSEFKDVKSLENGDVIFKYKDSFGVKDKNGMVFILPKHLLIENILFNNSNHFIIRSKDLNSINGALFSSKVALFDNSGTQITSFIDGEIIAAEGRNNNFLGYSLNNKFGVIDNKYEFLEPICDYMFFKNKVCFIVKNEKYGFLNELGNVAVEPKYKYSQNISIHFEYFNPQRESIGLWGPNFYIPSDKLMVIENENKYGLLNLEKYQEVAIVKYEKIGHEVIEGNSVNRNVFIKGKIPVRLNAKIGYIDEVGNQLIDCKYDEILGFGIKGYGNEKVSCVKNNNKYGLISNSTGLEITPIKYDNIYNRFTSSGTTIFEINKKKGILNSSGYEIISPRFDEILNFGASETAIVIENGLKGLINNEGSIIINPKYQEIGEFVNGNASVKYNNKWGVLNTNGIEIIKPIYDNQVQYEDGVANVSLGGKSSKIDANGEAFLNKFQNSKLAELTVDGESISSKIENMSNKLYTDIYAQKITNSLLGVKTNPNSQQNLINTKNRETKSIVEEWLGGPMTKSQLVEFNSINKKVLSQVQVTMGFVTMALNSPSAWSSSSSGSSGSSGSSSSVGKIYSGKSTSEYNQVAGFSNGKIYSGKSTSEYNQVGLIEGNKIYRGKSSSEYNQVGLIEGNKIYRGNSSSEYNIVGMFENNKIYRGNSSSEYNQIGTVEGGGATAAAAIAFMLLL